MKLDVIVRTHNKTNVHVQNESGIVNPIKQLLFTNVFSL